MLPEIKYFRITCTHREMGMSNRLPHTKTQGSRLREMKGRHERNTIGWKMGRAKCSLRKRDKDSRANPAPCCINGRQRTELGVKTVTNSHVTYQQEGENEQTDRYDWSVQTVTTVVPQHTEKR